MSAIQYKPRVDVEVLVNVTPEQGLSRLGRTSNISPSGMLLQISEALTIGHRLHMKLFLPGTKRQLDLAGEITREDGRSADGYRYGVRFLDVPADIEDDLEHFLAVRLDRHRPS